jgi:hypothetical protein
MWEQLKGKPMPRRIAPLSDLQIKNAKSREKSYKMVDGFGLHLLVTPSGGKLWQMQYRFLKKQKLLSFGAYPAVSLEDARKKRGEAKEQLAKGQDPGQVKKEQKNSRLEEGANTFEVVAREWHKKFESTWSAKHYKAIMARLVLHVFPFIGKRPISEIKVPELLAVLQRVELSSLETAFRVKTACGQVYRYAVASGRAERNLIEDLRGALRPVKGGHFAAPTDPKKVAPLLRAIEDMKAH